MSKHRRTKPVNHGGLLRCCITTLDEAEVEEVEGEVLPCKWCGGLLIFNGEVWRWYREEDKS